MPTNLDSSSPIPPEFSVACRLVAAKPGAAQQTFTLELEALSLREGRDRSERWKGPVGLGIPREDSPSTPAEVSEQHLQLWNWFGQTLEEQVTVWDRMTLGELWV